MSRYIDADKIPRHGKRGGECYWQEIEQLPTADVRENVRGEWIFKEDRRIVDGYDWKCDQCGSWQRYTSNFCPHCRADMREEKEGEEQ